MTKRENVENYEILNINKDYMKGISNLDLTQLATMAARDKVIVPGKPVHCLKSCIKHPFFGVFLLLTQLYCRQMAPHSIAKLLLIVNGAIFKLWKPGRNSNADEYFTSKENPL